MSVIIGEVQRLQDAIRAHRDARGDDRCWMDDEELYKVLPEGYTPPARDSAVELALCEKFIASRQHPVTVYVSPQREIDHLREALEGLAIDGVTAGANPLKEGGMSAPLWHMHCKLCNVQWSEQVWKQPRKHPVGKCILAEGIQA